MTNPKLRNAVIAELESALYPAGRLSKDEAWLGIIQLVSWYEYDYLHVIDSDKLHPFPKAGGKRVTIAQHDRTWQRHARAAEAYLAGVLGLPTSEMPRRLGLMWQHPFWQECETGNQKANPAGNALKFATAYALQRWGDSRFDYREEQPLTTYWPGIAFPSVKNPKADVLPVTHVGSRPVALVSCKWSMRTDRISNATRDCGIAKSVAHRMTGSLRFFVVCHEYDSSRISALLDDACIDGVALVNLPVMEAIGTVSPALAAQRASGRLLSLTEFIESTTTW